MPGGGDFVSFFRPGGRRFPLKSHPQDGDFDEKNSGPGASPEGMVTGQSDTCITALIEPFCSNTSIYIVSFMLFCRFSSLLFFLRNRFALLYFRLSTAYLRVKSDS